MIANWNRAFHQERIEGLNPKANGRPSMSKKPKEKQLKIKIKYLEKTRNGMGKRASPIRE